MEPVKYSIIACTYANGRYLENFLWTCAKQTIDDYEVIIVDNASPSTCVYDAVINYDLNSIVNQRPMISYHCIPPEEKQCTNITQGINIAADMARGQYLVIVADPHVLLSFNLLEKIDKLIDDDSVILSSGAGNDIKLSPDGCQMTEYGKHDPDWAWEQNCKILNQMGWPKDPLEMPLIKGTYRYPPPHNGYDCYIVAIAKKNFLKAGGYPTKSSTWGTYHDIFVNGLAQIYIEKRLVGVRVLHQFHRVWKETEAT